MPAAFQYKPRFVDIRVRPPKPEEDARAEDVNVLKPGGWLLTCSCSGHVSQEMFLEVLAKVAVHAGRHLQILEVRGASADHPWQNPLLRIMQQIMQSRSLMQL